MVNLILLISLLAGSPQQENPVVQPVRDLFSGMELGDSSLVSKAFTTNASMSTVLVREGKTIIRNGDLQGFINYIGSPRENKLQEPIWNIKVEQDGAFAQVWADYALYVDGEFSHCGVDAFHLANINGKWKIFSIVDTRRTSDCVIPADIKAQYQR